MLLIVLAKRRDLVLYCFDPQHARAIGLPVQMFTVLFAIGRLPGWIAHWREVRVGGTQRIDRPRQIYTGATKRAYVPLEQRK